MALTTAQKTTLKTHLAANTNTIAPFPSGANIAINVAIQNTGNGDNMDRVAAWYNSAATAGDSQPIAAPLNVWKPVVTMSELNSGINWNNNPAGATPADQTNSWLRYQSMSRGGTVDMTDGQVRKGFVQVWGSGTASVTGIAAIGVQPGTRLEVLLATAGTADAGDGMGTARKSNVFGYRITGPEIVDALLNG